LNKAPEAFRTISEVADELDLPQHVLRFWESRFAHIKPMKRGGGRRYYRPEDVDLLRGVRHLLYGDGYTIRGVQRILREQGVRAVQAIGQGHKVALPEPHPDDAQGDVEPADVLPPLFGSGTDLESDDPAEPDAKGPGDVLPARAGQPVLPFAATALPAQRTRALAPDDLDRLRRVLKSLEEARLLLDMGPAT
jgi:DNA-binding transcriptional MerR regulator